MSTMQVVRVTRRRFLGAAGLAGGAILLAACGGSRAAEAPAASTAGSAPSAASSAVSLEVDTASAPKEFRYVQATLKAASGSKIELKLVNKTNPKDEVGHNWVLVKPSQEDNVIATATAAGDDKDWLQEDDPNVLAHTRLIEGGETDSITFTAPAPGVYTYLCTFPDHYHGGEKGALTIA